MLQSVNLQKNLLEGEGEASRKRIRKKFWRRKIETEKSSENLSYIQRNYRRSKQE